MSHTKHLYTRANWKKVGPVVVAVICFLISGGMVSYKMLHLGYSVTPVDDEEAWSVRVVLDVESPRSNLIVRAMAPIPETGRQQVLSMTTIGAGFEIKEEYPYTVWTSDTFDGKERLVIKYRVQTRQQRYSIPAVMEWEETEAVGLEQYLKAEARIQSVHPDILAQAELLRSTVDDVTGFVRVLFDYVQDDVSYKKVGGPTDAITAYKLGEASCNGKNRLFIALARSQGIPARICKGLILQKGIQKKQSHAWSELFLNGQWIPFCPTGNHFAEIPANYLEYPKVDRAMFSYTKNVKFDRLFHINRGAITPEEAFKADLDNPDHALAAWGALNKADFSLSLLMVILTIPIGVTVVTFVRNIIGFIPLGTFLPALIAVSFRDTGLYWGLLLFTLVIMAGVLVNIVLKVFHILHFPRISIVLTCVVTMVLVLARMTNDMGYHAAAKVGMFPLAVLTLTIERFALIQETEGLGVAFHRLFASLSVSAVCFAVMMNFWLRSYMLVFPELLLVCIGVNLLIGVYTGLRFIEYIRFRMLIRKENVA